MDINTAKLAIKAADLANDTVIMQGQHGIGKSTIVKQYAKENDLHIEELFLSHQEVGDLIGIPNTIEIDGETVTTWSKPIWLKRIEQNAKIGKRTVLFLDELNRAPTDVRQSALQLVLEGQIHEHILPIVDNKRTLIVSAINPADDYQVDELDPALLDRFLFIEVEADVQAWLKYSNDIGSNKVVIDFIAQHPDRLFWQPADGGIGATPRSWTKLSNYMDNISEIPDEILFQVMKGKIGVEIASQFYSFYKDYGDTITTDDIIRTVETLSDDTDSVEAIADELRLLIEDTEVILKTELANQLLKYFNTNPLVLLAYLYALPMEVVVSFLKTCKNDNMETYKKIAEFDSMINDKQLFKKIIKASSQ
jgi:hypothetical protein